MSTASEAMNWDKLLCADRLNWPEYKEEDNRPSYVIDLDRIVFSAPFRRLANKTQVHPLYDNDHIHHRLIHSIETGSVGRSIGMSVGQWLAEEENIDKHRVSGIVQAACVAHDIGNPPFGHSGEAAIGKWFKEQFDKRQGLFGEDMPSCRTEFEEFEGNAQGFRILTRLEMYRNTGGMQLSHAVLGAFTKYPATSKVQNKLKGKYCGLKKFGIFETEEDIFRSVADKLGLISNQSENGVWWRRHPLVFLVEAADDICYNILDIEDAFIAGELDFKKVRKLFKPLLNKSIDEHNRTKAEIVANMRARIIGTAIEASIEAFKSNYKAIMNGTFSSSLIEKSRHKDVFDEIKQTANHIIFTAKRKTELEVFGRNVLHNVLNGLLPVYEELKEKDWNESALDDYNKKLVRALELDLRDVDDVYSALHSMTDFVSGMTDRYAVKISKMLSAQ